MHYRFGLTVLLSLTVSLVSVLADVELEVTAYVFAPLVFESLVDLHAFFLAWTNPCLQYWCRRRFPLGPLVVRHLVPRGHPHVSAVEAVVRAGQPEVQTVPSIHWKLFSFQ